MSQDSCYQNKLLINPLLQELKALKKRAERAVTLKMITAVKQLEFLELVLNKAGFFVPF